MRFDVKNGWKIRSRAAGSNAGTVVVDGDARRAARVRSIADSITTTGATDAPAHASTALRSRLLNAWRSSTSSPSTAPNSPRTVTSPPSAARLGPHLVGRALADRAQIDARQRQLRRTREIQEVGHDLRRATRSRRECPRRTAGTPPAARSDRTACCSRESSPGRCGTRARCRPSARRPWRGSPSGAAALRAPARR